MPWHRAPRCQGLTRPPAKFFYHITFYNTGVSEHEEWIGLFYRIATVLKSTEHFFYKRGPNPGPQDRVPVARLEHLLNFMLRYGYSLWYDVIFVDNISPGQ